MAVNRSRKRPGPQPKGVRRQFTVRVPQDQYEVYSREAKARGLSLGDYLTSVLARGHGLPEPDYLQGKGEMLFKTG